MNTKDAIALKQALHAACMQQVESRLHVIEHRLALIEDSRNNETKSSAGDKYETGRAMMQMEEEKSRAQLAEIHLVRQKLSNINSSKLTERIGTGALAITNSGKYYFSAGIGKLKYGQEIYFCVSMDSPIAQALRGQQAGSEITFNGKKIKIEKVV
jgi:hypothetical protein